MSAVPQSYGSTSETGFAAVRDEFPYLEAHPRLAYLDSAASTQKPRCVIDAIANYYSYSHANIHRGVYRLSQVATEKYDDAREVAAKFLGAATSREIVFVRGTTEGFNLLAQSFLAPRLTTGDEIIVSVAEHHANLVPWQMVCRAAGARIKAVRLTEDQQLDLSHLESLITPRTKLISLTHVSNALGSVTDVTRAVAIARAHQIPIALDGAQAVAHLPLNVRELDCDFYLFSGHKLYGPTGIGVLYAKEEHLSAMPPYQGGGDMIETVEIESSTYQAAPQRFEAGTPHIAGAVGLAAAMRFVTQLGREAIHAHERSLHEKAEAVLAQIPGLRPFGPVGSRVGSISFAADWAHPHDIGTILDQRHVAVRTGHHCAQPLMKCLGVGATTRLSFGVYSIDADIEALGEALHYAKRLLG